MLPIAYKDFADNWGMARVRSWQFLFAALVGTIVYALLSMTVGSDGVWCYKQLEEQRRAISSRAASIQRINDELNKERMALERDKSVIAAYAHRLEYVKDNEKLIKITGLKPYESILYDTGTALRHHDIKCMSEGTCKALGLVFFALVSLIMLLYDLASPSASGEYTSTGTQGHLSMTVKLSKTNIHEVSGVAPVKTDDYAVEV